ncbi:Do family serine endopeptidase [Pseudorhodoplanes sp.]|uniref:Do family serine endopeptidase n=1 Tax=Pseudorhodoplanes sp. TaxID=1934341 RepID=UPI00391B5A2D
MTPTTPPSPGGFLRGRRALLLGTTILSLGAAALFVAPDASRNAAIAQNVTQQAQTVQRPVGFADIVEKVKPAVISVRVKVNAGPQNSSFEDQLPQGFERFFRRFGEDMFPDMPNRGIPGMPRGPRQRTSGQGSGFFISADGYAVTNNHVVDRADEVEVQTDDGKIYTAKVIGTDPRTDLALIKVDGGNFPYAKLASQAPRIGDWVLAVGNPFGLSSTVTAGIVSARGRDIGAGPYDDFLQIDAPVNKGNSGGPTFDIDGNVVGVNTAIFSPSGGNVGIAFAIPAATVDSVVTQLREKGSVTRGWIGVQIQPITQDIADGMGLKSTDGALVAEPAPNSPAVKAGIKSGDVIVAVNGERIANARELSRRIGQMAPGNDVRLTILQRGSEKTVNVKLGELPAPTELSRRGGDERGGPAREELTLGLQLAPASSVAGSGNEGVVVTRVLPNSPAGERGLKTGDVILEVAGKAVSNPADVRKALEEARKDDKRTVLMRVKSGEGTRFVALPAGRA